MWAKAMRVAMVLATVAMFAVGGVGGTAGEASAHGASNHQCADVLANPTDANCYWYTKYLNQYRTWDNDRYAERYYNSPSGHARLQLKAANESCHGTLYEDFSCSGYKV